MDRRKFSKTALGALFATIGVGGVEAETATEVGTQFLDGEWEHWMAWVDLINRETAVVSDLVAKVWNGEGGHPDTNAICEAVRQFREENPDPRIKFYEENPNAPAARLFHATKDKPLDEEPWWQHHETAAAIAHWEDETERRPESE